jgi:hypothetical protein
MKRCDDTYIKQYKVANFVTDEKFIDFVIKLYDEEFDFCHHDFIYLSVKKVVSYKYIKLKDRILVLNTKNILSFIESNEYDAIFLHNFSSFPPSLLPLVPIGVKVFWFAWGYDIYEYPINRPFVNIDLYAPLTKQWIKSSAIFTKRKLKNIIKFCLKGESSVPSQRTFYRALNRVDYFAGILDYEYDLMKKNPEFRAKKTRHRYSSPSSWSSLSDSFSLPTGDNIFVGNSAALTNNHLDILFYLTKCELGHRQVILPLSYGNINGYADKVCAAYRKEIGQYFIPIINFMPLDQYQNLYKSCGIAIFGQERQAALGNIIYALRNGLKVFLSETNLVYKYFKEKNVYIYSFQKDLNQENIEKRLTREQALQNHRIINELYSKENYIACIDDLYRCLQE